jgi:microsomal epoxide hydrolase
LKASAVALWILLWSFPSVAAPAPLPAKDDKNPHLKSGFVSSWDGAEIHYIEAGRSKTPIGNAEGGNPLPPSFTITKGNISVTGSHQFPSILFIPGWTMPGWIWENQISHFSAEYRVVAMDPRSQGDSSKPSEGNYPASHARDIKAVIDQLHLAPVVVVGWSMAVTEIASYVDQFGTSGIEGIIFVDGVAYHDLTSGSFKSYTDFAKSVQTNRQKFTSDFVHSMYKKAQTEEYLHCVIKASIATPSDSAVAMAFAGLMTDNRPGLAKIDKPTVIVGATKDLAPTFRDMQKRIPGAKLEMFEDAGHALFVDDADKFNVLLEEFITNLK